MDNVQNVRLYHVSFFIFVSLIFCHIVLIQSHPGHKLRHTDRQTDRQTED